MLLLMRYICGAEFKLDVGLYQLDQQVACQRHRQTILDAKSENNVSWIDQVKNTLAGRQLVAA